MKRDKKLISLCIFFVLPIIGFSQEGVQFVHDLSWQKIQEKAKSEQKYILVDCYATWCVPCKLMEKNVYPNDSVGNYINENFISVKVQMDTSKNDDDQIKKWYPDAHKIAQDYNVNAFPTFLFISPEGKIVHKDVGYKNVKAFIELGKNALNPKTQYFTLLQNYTEGDLDSIDIVDLARTTYMLGDKATAFKIANDYITKHLLLLDDAHFYTKENIGFINQFTLSSKDPGFSIFISRSKRIDELMKHLDYAESKIDYIVEVEETGPILSQAAKEKLKEPNWQKMNDDIIKKYGVIVANRTINKEKIRWYGYKKEWKLFTKYSTDLLQRYGAAMSNDDLNAHAWPIFLYSASKKEISATTQWMKKAVETETDSILALPADMDTYANLLYKGGKTELAIGIEKKAIYLAIKFDVSNYHEEFQDKLNKMKKGEPTWLEPKTATKN